MAIGTLITSNQLMDKILMALSRNEPLSVISVGQTEAFVMAQYTIYPEEKFMQDPEVAAATRMIRGISFPNIKARDDAVEAVRHADIVGYNTFVASYRKLAEAVFAAYDLRPEFVFESNIRRVIMYSQKEKFEEMLNAKKLLLIGSQAKKAKKNLEKGLQKRLSFEIVDAISIKHYEEIPQVKEQIAKQDFDLCLIGAGINAVILAPYISKTFGKVAFDLGFGLQTLATEQIKDSLGIRSIGVNKLYEM